MNGNALGKYCMLFELYHLSWEPWREASKVSLIACILYKGTILGLILRTIYFQGQHDCMKGVLLWLSKDLPVGSLTGVLTMIPAVIVMYASILFKDLKLKSAPEDETYGSAN